jgi:hypothetical protein
MSWLAAKLDELCFFVWVIGGKGAFHAKQFAGQHGA